MYGDSVARTTQWRRPNVAGGSSLGFGDVERWRIAAELSLPVGFGVPGNVGAQVWRLARLLRNDDGTRSGDAELRSIGESSVSIGPRSDKMATRRRPHGGVAVLEATNTSVNTAKNE